MDDVLAISSEKLSIRARKLFLQDGGEIDNPALIRDNDVVMVSGGEPYGGKGGVSDTYPLYSIAVLGPGAVGKSALTLRYAQGQFVRDYDPTIEDAYRHNTIIDDRPCLIDILDTAGQEDYTALRATWMRERDGFLFVFSVVDASSLENLQTFYDQLSLLHEQNMPPVVVVGNKCDLKERRQISEEDGLNQAKAFQANYIETSAKTGENVEEAFVQLIRQVRKWVGEKPPQEHQPPKRRFWCAVL